MKKKINARTLTLISLIGALICAVLASLTLFCLSNSTEQNQANSAKNDTYISAPEKSVATTSDSSTPSQIVAYPYLASSTKNYSIIQVSTRNTTVYFGPSSSYMNVQLPEGFSLSEDSSNAFNVPANTPIGSYPIVFSLKNPLSSKAVTWPDGTAAPITLYLNIVEDLTVPIYNQVVPKLPGNYLRYGSNADTYGMWINGYNSSTMSYNSDAGLYLTVSSVGKIAVRSQLSSGIYHISFTGNFERVEYELIVGERSSNETTASAYLSDDKYWGYAGDPLSEFSLVGSGSVSGHVEWLYPTGISGSAINFSASDMVAFWVFMPDDRINNLPCYGAINIQVRPKLLSLTFQTAITNKTFKAFQDYSFSKSAVKLSFLDSKGQEKNVLGTAENVGKIVSNFDGVTLSGAHNGSTVTISLTAFNQTVSASYQLRVDKISYTSMGNAKWDYSSAFTYDGNGKSVSVTGLPDGVSPKYSGTTSATNAGSYTATVTGFNYDTANYNEPAVPSGIASLSWTINKANQGTPNISASSSQVAYNSKITLNASGGNGGTFNWRTSNGNINLSATNGAQISATGAYPGTVMVTMYCAETSNYNSSGETSIEINVVKATQSKPNITGATSVIYGKQLSLQASGGSGGTYTWSVTPSSGKATPTSGEGENITLTATQAGTITVNLYRAANTYYNQSETASVTITIDKATFDMSGVNWNYSSAFTYNANEQSVTLNNLPDGASVSGYNGNSYTNAGNYTASVTGFDYDQTNYNAPLFTTVCNWVIKKATPTTTPSIAGGTFFVGNPLSSVGISGSAIGVSGTALSGTFYWTDPSIILEIGTASYEWTFEPVDATNYVIVMGNAKIAAIGMDFITVSGAKTTYKAYEAFTTNGMVVSAGSGSTTRPVTGYTLTIPYEAEGRNSFLVKDSGCEITITYTEAGKTVTTTISITVNKADYDMSAVRMTNKTVTYDGNEKSIIYSGELPTGVRFSKYTYDSKDVNGATNAGTYAVKALFTIDDGENYNVPELSATLTIEKATPTATPNILAGTYYVGDGLLGVTISVGTSSVGGTIAWTNDSGTITGLADSYGWTFTPTDTDNYNKATGVVQVTAYYKLTGITVTGAKTEYKAHESFDTTGMVVTATYAVGKADTAVENYTVTYPIDGATEFVISDDGKSMTVSYTENGITKTAEITITINANSYDMSGVSMDDLTVTYDGETHKITVSGTLPDGVEITGYTYNGTAATGAMNAGTYTVEAVIEIADPDNYKMPTLSATLTINKAQGVIDVSGVKTDYTYNGKLQTVDSGATVDNDEQTIVYSNNTFTTVAEGNGLVVEISVAESANYLAASATVTLVVNKATPTLDVSGVETQYTYTGELQTVDSGATIDNDEQTIVYSNNTFTTVAEGDGLTVQIAVAESANYLADSKTVTISVDKATVSNSVTFTDKTVTYNGATHTLTVVGTLADDITVSYTYNGSEFNGATDVDSYEITVHFECTSGNYYDHEDMTATLTIEPYEVSGEEVTGIEEKYTYTGATIKPEPTVKVTLADGETVLNNYTLTYSSEDYAAGTEVTVKLEFSGNYSGTVEKTFTITKAQLTLEWAESENGYEYNGMQQGTGVIGVTGLVGTDAGVMPNVTYTGRGNTAYGENTEKPKNAGQYTAKAELDERLFDNYEYSAANVLTKQFEIRKADVSVSVRFENYDPDTKTLYEGEGLPAIELKGDATAGELIVQGTLAWSQVGDEPVSLELGAKQYAWVFTPKDAENFNVTMGVIRIEAAQAVIQSLTVRWRDGAQPTIYTSTTLSDIRRYLLVEGELTGNKGTVEIVGYTIKGSWGTASHPAADDAGTHYYTITFNGDTALLPNVEYTAILLIDLRVEAATSEGIQTTYNGLDEFNRDSIKVTAVYNDKSEIEVTDYKIIYNDGHEELWVGDRQVIISYNNGSLEEDMQRVIDGLTVKINTYDLSDITIRNMTTDYDGNVKTYAIRGEFGIGSVTYTYAKQTEDGWQTVPSTSVKDAGTYRVTVKFTVEGEKYISNYEEVPSQQITLVINKVDYAGVDEIGFEVTSADYDYGNSVAGKIKVENTPADVEITYEYKDADGNVLRADEVVNAGEYTVTVKFGVDDNHYAIAPITVNFTINKLKPTVDPTVGGSLSQGTKLYQLMFISNDGDAAGTYAWVNDEQELQAGINRCYYTFTPDDGTNFETVKAYIDLNVSAVSDEAAAGGGNLSSGAIAGLVVAMAVIFLIAIIALLAALRKKSYADPDGFNDPIDEDDLKM